MRTATFSGTSARAVREFGLAVRSGPFQLALALSVLVHVVLLVVALSGHAKRGDDKRIPLMRVRLLRSVSEPGSAPNQPPGPVVHSPTAEEAGLSAVRNP